jgi:Fe-S-cluster containining protein
MYTTINMDLSEKDFRLQIEELIKNSRKNELAIPLPSAECNQTEYIALFLSQIKCTNCEALCCRSTVYAKFGIPFIPTEYQILENRIGKEKLEKLNIKTIGKSKYFPVPCPFLRKKQCTIYDIRPQVCIQYPYSPNVFDNEGQTSIAVDSFCPEARRIAKQTWMTLWKLINKLKELAPQLNDIKETGLSESKLEDI